MTANSLIINRPHVVDETIDGETILIHLGTGVYYSLDGLASDVWTLVTRGASAEQTADIAAAAFPDDSQAVRSDVRALIDELAAEDLIRESATLAHAGPTEIPQSRGEYAVPILHKYTDMQAFMLADPLHDVDEQVGWPHVNAG